MSRPTRPRPARRHHLPLRAALVLLAVTPLLVGLGGLSSACRTACDWLMADAQTAAVDQGCCSADPAAPMPQQGHDEDDGCCDDSTSACQRADDQTAPPPPARAEAPSAPPAVAATFDLPAIVPLVATMAPMPVAHPPPATPVRLSVRLDC